MTVKIGEAKHDAMQERGEVCITDGLDLSLDVFGYDSIERVNKVDDSSRQKSIEKDVMLVLYEDEAKESTGLIRSKLYADVAVMDLLIMIRHVVVSSSDVILDLDVPASSIGKKLEIKCSSRHKPLQLGISMRRSAHFHSAHYSPTTIAFVPNSCLLDFLVHLLPYNVD